MSKSEFRFNRRRKHPSYVFDRKGDTYQSILITHAPRTGNRKNKRLYKNPQPGNNTTAYVVPKVYKDNTSSYNAPYHGWEFHPNDKRLIKRIKKGKKV